MEYNRLVVQWANQALKQISNNEQTMYWQAPNNWTLFIWRNFKLDKLKFS